MRELVCGKSNPYSQLCGGIRGHRPRSKNEPTSNAYALPGASLQTKSSKYIAIATKRCLLCLIDYTCKQVCSIVHNTQKSRENLCFYYISRTFRLRKVRDSNPRYNAMCTPHFECGSFDHSDNFPQLRVQRYNNFLN